MKAILMSIRPKWVEKIANGEKTVEVRKTVPKCDQPFKVYMYCTKEKTKTMNCSKARVLLTRLYATARSLASLCAMRFITSFKQERELCLPIKS